MDTSRVALALARTRIMSARFPYYVLADSEEALRRKRSWHLSHVPHREHSHDVRQGFVYKRVPHVMLSAIAGTSASSRGCRRTTIEQ